MYSIGIPQNSIYAGYAKNNNAAQNQSLAAPSAVKKYADAPSFGAENPQAPAQQGPSLYPKMLAPTTVRTVFATKQEQDKFVQLYSILDKKEKTELAMLLKAGVLLNDNSNDNSTTLENLYKIASTERAPGLNPQVVLKETLNTIANPFVITQNFGDIPKQYKEQILKEAQPNPKTPNDQINEKTIAVPNSSDCVSASIEFNLAKQNPAEFARFAEGLTSPKMSVDKKIQLKNLTDNTLDSVFLLNTFEIPYKMEDFDEATVTLAPDKNATIRAQIQNSHKDKLERSVVDVLMQSTFMNVGSQGTYDSLTDIRGGKFNYDNTGLIEFEKTFTESVVQDKNKISVTYQNLDENAKFTGYTTDFATIKKNILDSLAIGENVIIGYTQLDDKNSVIGGHEITIIGAAKDKNGKTIFICNDTDDNNPNPIVYSEDYIIPKIHHAGLPQQVVAKDTQVNESWKESLKAYKDAKTNEKTA